MLLDCDPDGQMRYSLIVPENALPAVSSALGAFDRVRMQVIEPNPEPPAGKVEVVRAELRLGRPSSEPLALLPLSPDPLQGFAGVLGRLDPAQDEQAEVAIDLLPPTVGTRRRLRRRLLKEAMRRSGGDATGSEGGGGLLGFGGGGGRVGRRRPAEMVEQRAEREEIAAKLVQAEPIFRLQVLIGCSSPERGRAIGCLQGVLSGGWPRASQPPAPSDPGVTVSRHRALLTSRSGRGDPLPVGE